mmetsp:Transcript_19023/g.35690  ORF Transcript_19023/g.35690 Transcript_19023/m.35690 type:complete len:202 (+) Transcript_19023:28-633(+)
MRIMSSYSMKSVFSQVPGRAAPYPTAQTGRSVAKGGWNKRGDGGASGHFSDQGFGARRLHQSGLSASVQALAAKLGANQTAGAQEQEAQFHAELSRPGSQLQNLVERLAGGKTAQRPPGPRSAVFANEPWQSFHGGSSASITPTHGSEVEGSAIKALTERLGGSSTAAAPTEEALRQGSRVTTSSSLRPLAAAAKKRATAT